MACKGPLTNMPNVGSIKILLLPSKVKGFLRRVYKFIQIKHVHHRTIFFFIRENGQKCKNNIISSQTQFVVRFMV